MVNLHIIQKEQVAYYSVISKLKDKKVTGFYVHHKSGNICQTVQDKTLLLQTINTK